MFNKVKESKKEQIESWKKELTREIEIEYELIRQAGIRNRRKETNRFLEKWSKYVNIIRIEENEKGIRRLVVNL